MSYESFHIPDYELLAAADGELSAAKMKKVRRHLEACWTCRARMSAIELAIVDFVQAHQQSLNAQLPSASGPRALLQVRLRQAASTHHVAWHGLSQELAAGCRQLLSGRRGLAFAAAVIIAALGLVAVRTLRVGGEAESRAAMALGVTAPNPRITPGATLPITRAQACAMEGMDRSPEVPRTVALRVFAEYGIVDPSPRSYELDYLITPELGGSDDVRNLWPQPYQTVAWNAHAKDALEDHLHQLVCGGSLDLEIAQRDIAADWIAAYKKYFRTNEPLSMHASFLKDRPFE
jgi:hypothetical protein